MPIPILIVSSVKFSKVHHSCILIFRKYSKKSNYFQFCILLLYMYIYSMLTTPLIKIYIIFQFKSGFFPIHYGHILSPSKFSILINRRSVWTTLVSICAVHRKLPICSRQLQTGCALQGAHQRSYTVFCPPQSPTALTTMGGDEK